MKFIVSAAGGANAENYIANLKIAEPSVFTIGTDNDPQMLQLSGATVKMLIPLALAKEDYIRAMNHIAKRCNTDGLFLVNDNEIYYGSKFKDRLPNVCLPSAKLVELCRDKGELALYLNEHLPNSAPKTYITDLTYRSTVNKEKNPCKYPAWMRSTIGAGGDGAIRITCWQDVEAQLQLHPRKFFMISDYLDGKCYSWNALYVHGELAFSVLKERQAWVYRRIGTASVQQTIHNCKINLLCHDAIKTLIDEFDNDMTSLMMIDLKEDYKGEPYITEINAGRTGTAGMWYGLASQEIYHDARANFHHQLARVMTGQNLLPIQRFDALPADITYIRHIDMGYKLAYGNTTLIGGKIA